LLGHAFFLIGLHPNSSRLARKFSYKAMVFNLHEQFEMLREMKSFDIVSEKIRTRDQELQGSMNPMLAEYGEISEARQYSGRKVEDNWKCPFHKSNI
nr:YqcI/YcgG family protein [Bacteroidota bacterium]